MLGAHHIGRKYQKDSINRINGNPAPSDQDRVNTEACDVFRGTHIRMVGS